MTNYDNRKLQEQCPYTLMIIDCHILLRSVIAAYLNETRRFKVVAEFATTAEAKNYFKNDKIAAPDVILINMNKDVEHTVEFIKWLKIKTNHILVYSDYTSCTHVNAAVAAGARGFLGNNENLETLCAMLNLIAKGQSQFSQTALEKMTAQNELRGILTTREFEIFKLVQQLYPNCLIADELQLSAHTIENYMSSLYAKTKCETREDLQSL
ncbi:MAG: response regulator transcription factor [Termitinemataceae bacterium]|nr:MAG: response regulator transcription factor [Termitinemataceae bacterium]